MFFLLLNSRVKYASKLVLNYKSRKISYKSRFKVTFSRIDFLCVNSGKFGLFVPRQQIEILFVVYFPSTLRCLNKKKKEGDDLHVLSRIERINLWTIKHTT